MSTAAHRVGVVLLVALVLAGCTQAGGQGSTSSAHSSGPPIVYVAISGSDGVGVGATNPLNDAWPQVFYRTALPESTILYNLSDPGLTVAKALDSEAPEALTLNPTLVTIWLNLNDLIAQVAPSDYEAELDQLVHAMRRGGQTTVLVANTPLLDRLPAYVECHAGTATGDVTCPRGLTDVAPADVNARVDAYNAAISTVVQQEGAVLVDLHAGGETAETHPDWVSDDGFHPSTAGYAAIAAMFAASWKQASEA